jgi:hypothetical protein
LSSFAGVCRSPFPADEWLADINAALQAPRTATSDPAAQPSQTTDPASEALALLAQPAATPAPAGSSGACPGAYKETHVDPYAATEGSGRYKSFAAAICNVKSPGKVIVHRIPGGAFAETIYVTKPDLTFESKDGGPIVVAPPEDANCLVVAPPSVKEYTRTFTQLSNFVFKPGSTATGPCIDVRFGALNLINSRIDTSDFNNTAISVAGPASLSFRGSHYDDHGIFVAPGVKKENPVGVGVLAASSRAVAIMGVKIAGLKYGVLSNAVDNAFVNVAFIDNDSAVFVIDDAAVSNVSPSVGVFGGAFRNNTIALRLRDASVGPDHPATFRGPLRIGGSRGQRAIFANNGSAIDMLATEFEGLFVIEDADFHDNASAIALPITARSEVELQNVGLWGNGAAIVIRGPLNGQLRMLRNTVLAGGPGDLGVVIQSGSGRFEADLASVGGLQPAFRIGAPFYGSGYFDIAVASDARPTFVSIDKDADLCRARGEDLIARIDELNVTIAGRLFRNIYADGRPLTKKAARKAKAALCKRD